MAKEVVITFNDNTDPQDIDTFVNDLVELLEKYDLTAVTVVGECEDEQGQRQAS